MRQKSVLDVPATSRECSNDVEMGLSERQHDRHILTIAYGNGKVAFQQTHLLALMVKSTSEIPTWLTEFPTLTPPQFIPFFNF